jgi:glutaredoxin
MSIILYTKTGCPWCDDTRALLEGRKVKFEEREVLANPRFFAQLIAISGQTKTPTLDINGEIIADTDRQTVERWLDEHATG